MSEGRWWRQFFRIEAVDSFVRNLFGGSGALSLIATIWAATRENAPSLTSVGWLAVFLGTTAALIVLVGLAGWAVRNWRGDGEANRLLQPHAGKHGGDLAAGFLKHTAPRQDDIEDRKDWERVCIGGAVHVAGATVYKSVRATIEVYDPNGWRFAEETFVDRDLRPGDVPDCYPIEIHLNRETSKLRYWRDGEWAHLSDDELLTYRLVVTCEKFAHQPIEMERYARNAVSASDRFVLDEEES